MTTTPIDLDSPDLRPTPTGWLAVAHDYPRIAVTAETEEEAVRLFRESRQEWRLSAQRAAETSVDEGSGDG